MNGFSLEGKVALVTEGARGLGRGIALALGEAGADVVLASRTKFQVDKVAQKIKALGR